MESADHFAKEVVTTMTQLVEVLESAQDSVITAVFKKLPQVEDISAFLGTVSPADIKNTTKASQIAK